MKNSYGNYVVQKALNNSEGETRSSLSETIRKNIPLLPDQKLRNKWTQILEASLKREPLPIDSDSHNLQRQMLMTTLNDPQLQPNMLPLTQQQQFPQNQPQMFNSAPSSLNPLSGNISFPPPGLGPLPCNPTSNTYIIIPPSYIQGHPQYSLNFSGGMLPSNNGGGTPQQK